MEISIFLARFWGIFWLFEATIYLFRLGVFANRLRDRAFVDLDGYLSLTFGIATVVLHNVWVTDWRLAVTLLGWLFLLRAIGRLGFPEQVLAVTSALADRPWLMRLMLVFMFAVGGGLVWVSR